MRRGGTAPEPALRWLRVHLAKGTLQGEPPPPPHLDELYPDCTSATLQQPLAAGVTNPNAPGVTDTSHRPDPGLCGLETWPLEQGLRTATSLDFFFFHISRFFKREVRHQDLVKYLNFYGGNGLKTSFFFFKTFNHQLPPLTYLLMLPWRKTF